MLWHASSGMPHFASLMNCLYPDREVVDMSVRTPAPAEDLHQGVIEVLRDGADEAAPCRSQRHSEGSKLAVLKKYYMTESEAEPLILRKYPTSPFPLPPSSPHPAM